MRIFFSAFAVLALCSSGFAAEFSGMAKVVDGDTLYIGETRIRLFGIDAPETDQVCVDASGRSWSCGLEARDRLAERVSTQLVSCAPKDRDQFGRVVASCRSGGEDLEARLVRQGLAVAYSRYSHSYEQDERIAEISRAGMWAGAFINPWDWRHRNLKTVIRGSVSSPANAQNILLGELSGSGPAACLIKGNVNHAGERIYHLPGQRYYEQNTHG